MANHIDKDEVKSLAQGRWAEIILAIYHVDPFILNGNGQPCKKCGGKDRFRFTDKNGSGSFFCNGPNCMKSSDGFGTIAFLTDRDCKTQFGEILAEVAEHLGVKPPSNGKLPAKRKTKEARSPSSQLDFRDWTPALAELWCQSNAPITPEAIQQVGGRIARYRTARDGVFTVFAFPAQQPGKSNPVGWLIINLSGGTLPAYSKDSNGKWNTTWVSKKILHGGEPGLFGVLHGGNDLIKVEGITDLLAIVSQGVGENEDIVSNAHGTKENPASMKWLPDYFSGKDVTTCHDADRPGQDGATDVNGRPGWATYAAKYAKSSRLVQLPYEVVETKGKDLRDYFLDGHTRADFDRLVEQAEVIEPPDDKPVEVIEADDDPHRLARMNLEHYATENAGAQLRYWRDEWYTWRPKDNCYRSISDGDLTAKVNYSIKREFDRLNRVAIEGYNEWLASDDYDEAKDKGPPKAKKVTRQLVNNVLDATRGLARISASVVLGSWLIDNPPFPAEGVIAARNGLIHLPNLTAGKPAMVQPTADFFNTTAIPFAFDPKAECPEWLAFLKSLWPKDRESINSLQQWFGYVISRETKHQKIFCTIGPKRSGKGTIVRVLTEIAGPANVANPKLSSLANGFGLQRLFGKTLAVVTDARLSTRLDSVEIVEELLSISGEDGKDIERKYLPTLTGVRMGVRFMLMSNEIPRLVDASGAITSRLIVLRQTKSFFGREDFELYGRLQRELPGVLNWAIRGWEILNSTGRFIQPRSGRQDLREAENLASPILAFVRECCSRKNHNAIIDCDELFTAWREWCEKSEHKHHGTKSTFGRNLRAACPGIRSVRPGSRDEKRVRVYQGIALKANGL